jgi:heptosyltransferase-2
MVASVGPKKFLIVKVGAIGDVVMALPMVSALKAADQDAHITWICGRTVAGLLGEVREIDSLIVLDETRLLAGGPLAKILEIFRVWMKTFFKRYDTVFVGHSNRAYRLLALATLKGSLRSFGTRPDGHALPAPARHHSGEYVRMVTGVNGSDMPVVTPYKLVANSGLGLKRVGLAPGGARNAKRDTPHRRWPIESYVTLARFLIANGYQVTVFGAPSDEWVLPAFGDMKIESLVGKLNLLETTRRLAEMSCVVTHDSGPAHLTGLSATPLVVLFGPTNPLNFAPLGPHVTVLTNEKRLPCQPCYDGLECAPCPDYRCMREIAVPRVLGAVTAAIEAASEAAAKTTRAPSRK